MTCGRGVKNRKVTCIGISSKCNPYSKPRTTLKCNDAPCPEWRTGLWSKVQKMPLSIALANRAFILLYQYDYFTIPLVLRFSITFCTAVIYIRRVKRSLPLVLIGAFRSMFFVSAFGSL